MAGAALSRECSAFLNYPVYFFKSQNFIDMSFKNITLEKERAIALIAFNRPEVLNALNGDTLKELCRAVTRLGEDQDVRVIIITGSGKAFVAGADIAEMQGYTPDEARRFSQLGHKAMDAIQNAGKPVIAAVNGYALGGGLELALACDVIIASRDARLGLPEVNLGLMPGFGGTQRLPRLIGKSLAKELIFTGDVISAQRAYELGMVSRVVPLQELLDEARMMAEKIAGKGPIAVGLAKEAIDRGYHEDLSLGCSMETDAFVESFKTADAREGMKAFTEKRKPLFKGK